MKNYHVADMGTVDAVPCPCGQAKRAFQFPGSPASFHVVEITEGEARKHYHKRMTEIYYVLEGEGWLEVDDEKVALKPSVAVMIQPGCRHRAVGNLKIINVPIPAFDPEDEWFD